LAACGVHGVMLVLSQEGGIAGERTLPLLVTDADWDALSDRLRQLLRDLEDQDIARVLLGPGGVLRADVDAARPDLGRALSRLTSGRRT
jgi:hypothetical protein